MSTFEQHQSHTDYIIIGAGPAGLQAAYFLGKAGISYVILERAREAGAFFRVHPRHRKLLSINKVYTGTSDPEVNLRWDWNSLLSEEYSPLLTERTSKYFPDADDLVDYLHDFAQHHQLAVEFGVSVGRIERSDSGFEVRADDGRVWTSHRVISATGLSLEHVPDIPGVELCERYATMSVNPEEFTNQKVLIVGKGNSAFETAEHLISNAASIHLASPRPLRLAWRTHFVGDLRAVNNNVLDTYQLKSQNAIIDGEITNIRHNGKGYCVEVRYAHADGEVETLEYDRVLLCTGFRFDASMFGESCRPQMTDCGKLPSQTSCWESTNVNGLFFAGTIMQERDYKKYMSAFIHGFRYNIRSLCRYLLSEFHGVPWPEVRTVYSARSVAKEILAEINRSSAIWQQPGFLATVVVLDPEARTVRLLDEVPMDYAHELFQRSVPHALTVTLEYGPQAADPFHAERIHRTDVDRAAQSSFLHPVIRRFENGQSIDEHHVVEDLSAEWLEPEHIDPLVAYLQGVLTMSSGIAATAESMSDGLAAAAG